MTVIIGVDPGAVETGVCAVHQLASGGVEADGYVIERGAVGIERYAVEVVESILDLIEALPSREPHWVAVEGVTRVVPQMGRRPIDLFPVVEAAAVMGAVAVTFEAIVVPPGGHGSNDLRAYPRSLVGDRERKGTGRMRHARSAYDVALASRTYRRLT